MLLVVVLTELVDAVLFVPVCSGWPITKNLSLNSIIQLANTFPTYKGDIYMKKSIILFISKAKCLTKSHLIAKIAAYEITTKIKFFQKDIVFTLANEKQRKFTITLLFNLKKLNSLCNGRVTKA